MFATRTKEAVLLLIAALAAFHCLGQAATLGQTPVYTPDAVTQDLQNQVEQLQEELRYLRERDAQRTLWESRVEGQLPRTGDSFQPISYGSEEAATSLPHGGTCVSGCQQSSCTTCGDCKGSRCCCGAYSCLCPPKEAPCVECPRATTLNPYFNVHVFGAAKLDMVFSDARGVSPGTPYFLLPASPAGFSQETVDIHGRQSLIGAAFTGPEFCGFQAGGMLLGSFYNDNALADAYGFLPMQAWGDLKNENWRFAAGYQFDVFNPVAPNVLPFSALCGSGNAGNAWRGQVRVERFLNPHERAQWTLQMALSEPIATVIDPTFGLNEDNGWPNVEGRIALALGCADASAGGKRPFEIGVSGVVGQIRNTDLDGDNLVIDRYVTDVWGLGADLQWKINDTFGLMGEVYTGEGLGTYNGAALQLVNPLNNYQAIGSTGGWLETYVYWTPCVHSHFGYGIDDPRDGDVPAAAAFLGRIENRTLYGNVMWDINDAFRVAFELAWRETDFRNARVPDNDGMFAHTQFTWNF